MINYAYSSMFLSKEGTSGLYAVEKTLSHRHGCGMQLCLNRSQLKATGSFHSLSKEQTLLKSYVWKLCNDKIQIISSRLCQASLREISLAAGKVIVPPHTYTASYIPRSTGLSSMKSPFNSSSCAFLNHVRIWPLWLQCHWVMISSVNHKKDKEMIN